MMNRGEIWLAEVGQKRRPVLVLTRTEVIDVRALVTVAEISTTMGSTGAEVELDHAAAGLDHPSVINVDGLHTILRSSLTTYVGAVDDDTLGRVCDAVTYAIGCPSSAATRRPISRPVRRPAPARRPGSSPPTRGPAPRA